MNWTKLLYVLMIVLIYVPMVFLGANVFFPEYTGSQSYYQGRDCYKPYPAEPISETTRTRYDAEVQECQKEYQKGLEAWENAKNAYEGRKYVFVALFNLAVLFIALFIPRLQDSVTMGLFMGSIGATFGATIRYFNTRSKIGFLILVITFFAMLYFINRKKDTFVDWKEKKH